MFPTEWEHTALSSLWWRKLVRKRVQSLQFSVYHLMTFPDCTAGLHVLRYILDIYISLIVVPTVRDDKFVVA